MTKILFLDRFGEINYQDVSGAYVSSFQEVTRFVCGTVGWDMPREKAEALVRMLAAGDRNELIDLTGLGNAE
jgi:hypothetical protein